VSNLLLASSIIYANYRVGRNRKMTFASQYRSRLRRLQDLNWFAPSATTGLSGSVILDDSISPMLDANQSNITAPGSDTPAVPEWDLGTASSTSKNNIMATDDSDLILAAAPQAAGGEFDCSGHPMSPWIVRQAELNAAMQGRLLLRRTDQKAAYDRAAVNVAYVDSCSTFFTDWGYYITHPSTGTKIGLIMAGVGIGGLGLLSVGSAGVVAFMVYTDMPPMIGAAMTDAAACVAVTQIPGPPNTLGQAVSQVLWGIYDRLYNH
jgi:hypothetical protein